MPFFIDHNRQLFWLEPSDSPEWRGETWVEIGDDEAEAIRKESEVRPLPTLSFAQLLTGLVSEGWITEAEGNDWLAGTLPAPIAALIDTLPLDQRFAAKARAIRPSEVLRNDPLVVSMGTSTHKTDAEMDDFFRKYAGG